MKKILTLCMVCKDGEILLGLKKRGFGEGRWNGFGGKVEEGETIEDAAARELREEAGIELGAQKKIGILDFSFANDPKLLEVHVFKVTDFTRSPVESEEMKPQWFKFSDIPFDQMWSDDEQWFPYMLGDKPFRGKFHFDKPSDAEHSAVILAQELTEVDEV